MMGALEQLQHQATYWGMQLSNMQLSLLSRYADILADYKLANVIGTSERADIILEHLIDSLSCFMVEDLRAVNSLVDVGAGAGLPGIPLAIARSDLRITLLEATEKKVRFLDYATAALHLKNLEVLHMRAEDAGRLPAYREAFDLGTARALA